MEEYMRPAYEKRISRILQKIDPTNYSNESKPALEIGSTKKSKRPPLILTEQNRKLLLKYYQSLVNSGMSLTRTGVLLGVTARLIEILGKDYETSTKDDIEQIVTKIRIMKLSEVSKVDYLLKLKRFDKWVNGGEEYSEKTKKIKTRLEKKYTKLPKELITPEEAKVLIDNAESARDRALIHFLWESGCRVGEAINLQISSVEFGKGEYRIDLYGKMGNRRILLLESTRDLQNYLKLRADAKPDEPLFTLHGTVNRGEAMSHTSISKVLKRTSEKAGITKKIFA
jgi:site-specific recombinase XerD